jgi:hypothetical protein
MPAVADLNETHEYQAHWWIPGLEDFRAFGTVTFNQNSLWLKVEGNLKGKEPTESRSPVLFGQNLQGEKFTFDGAFELTKREDDSNVFSKTTWYGSRLIKGKHVINFDEESYSAMTIQIPGLESTCTPTQIFGTIRVVKEKSGDVSGYWHQPEGRLFTLFDKDGKKEGTLSLSFGCLDQKNSFSLTLQHMALVIISTEKEKSVDWMQKKAIEVQNLFSLLNGFSTPLKDVGIHDKDSTPFHVLFHHRATTENGNEEMHGTPMILVKDLSQAEFQNFLTSYFSAPKLLEELVNIFLSILHRKATFYKTEFIELTQLLEAYDRHQNPDCCYMEQDKYLQEIYPQLFSAIPGDLENDFQKKLEGMLKWGYEYSLVTRLKRIAKRLPADLQSAFCEKPSRFSSKISSTRNQITHYTTETDSECLTDFETTLANYGLKILLLVIILLNNKIPEKLVLQGIQRNWDYRMFAANKPW